MTKQSFNSAISYISTKSFCINIAPTLYVRTDKSNFITDKEYVIVRDIEHNNHVSIIPYESILLIHE